MRILSFRYRDCSSVTYVHARTHAEVCLMAISGSSALLPGRQARAKCGVVFGGFRRYGNGIRFEYAYKRVCGGGGGGGGANEAG